MKKLITKTIEKIASKNIDTASYWYAYEPERPESLLKEFGKADEQTQ